MFKSLFTKVAPPTSSTAESTKTEDEAKAPSSRSYTVGWLLLTDRHSVIWEAPKSFRPDYQKNPISKSVTQCPAVLDFDRRFFVVPSPIDLHLRLTVKNNEIGITNMLLEKSPIRPETLAEMVVFQPQREWRHPNRPVLQMITSYIFVSDDPVFVDQFPPFLHYGANPRPGVQINGRFPIDIWPRSMQWAFEWHDTSKDLIIKRGEPLFYVYFEGPDPTASVRLIEAKRTPELMTHIDSITGVTEYVTQTFSLFKNARERRPERLLFPKD